MSRSPIIGRRNQALFLCGADYSLLVRFSLLSKFGLLELIELFENFLPLLDCMCHIQLLLLLRLLNVAIASDLALVAKATWLDNLLHWQPCVPSVN